MHPWVCSLRPPGRLDRPSRRDDAAARGLHRRLAAFAQHGESGQRRPCPSATSTTGHLDYLPSHRRLTRRTRVDPRLTALYADPEYTVRLRRHRIPRRHQLAQTADRLPTPPQNDRRILPRAQIRTAFLAVLGDPWQPQAPNQCAPSWKPPSITSTHHRPGTVHACGPKRGQRRDRPASQAQGVYGARTCGTR